MKQNAMPAGRQGFSLIELLVVIAIIASIVAMAIPNYLSARQRAKDSKKKTEMNQLKNALRLYYNDYNSYPGGTGTGLVMNGCGADGTSACPCTGTSSFATGATCDNVYMKQFPSGFLSTPTYMYYYQTLSGEDFCLRTILDNKSDPDIAISQTRCTKSCGTSCSVGSVDRYCVCAD